jgi:hypothetical protein
MKGLGEYIKETMVVQKVLRYIPSRLDAKVYAIEEIHEQDKLTTDMLHGILTTYEMRTRKGQPDIKDSVSKESVKLSTSQDHDSSKQFSDEEEVNFVRKLKMISKKFGHFSSKCTFKENNYNEKKDNTKINLGISKRKKDFKRNIFYSKEDNSSLSHDHGEEFEPDAMEYEKLSWL